MSETDAAALHVLEHWVLEGAGPYKLADDVFEAARDLGGSIKATITR